MGTSVGTRVFNAHGWRAAAALSVGWHGFCLLMILVRGPHCKRYTWFGYEGGYSVKKSAVHKEGQDDKEKQTPEHLHGDTKNNVEGVENATEQREKEKS